MRNGCASSGLFRVRKVTKAGTASLQDGSRTSRLPNREAHDYHYARSSARRSTEVVQIIVLQQMRLAQEHRFFCYGKSL